MRNKKIPIFFSLILFLAIFLRFFMLGEVPPGVNRDEASIGYTAYSLLKTGKDEYGRIFPVSFESFGDWKLPLYIYITIPFISLLGLTDIAVRLPSAIAGVGTVIATYFLVKRMFGNTTLALLSMFVLAVSPWHLHFSRVGYEANVAVFFIVIAVIFFLKGIKENRSFFIICAIFFSLTYYTYHGNHVFTTLLLFIMALIYWKSIRFTKVVFLSGGIFTVLVGFILLHTLLQANTTKISGTGIFGNPAVVYEKIDLPRLVHQNQHSLLTRFIHNKVAWGSEKFLQNYIQAFSPDFLFINGGLNRTHNIRGMGNMYIIEAPLLLLGFIYLLMKLKGKEKRVLLAWLLIAPLAASITKDAPHSARTLAILPSLSIITAMGIYWLMLTVSAYRHVVRNILVVLICVVYAFNFTLYMDRYYVHFPLEDPAYWGIGYEKLTNALMEKKYVKKDVVITHPEYSPYIFILFYGKIDPAYYQQVAVRYPPTADKFKHVKKFDRFSFREIKWEQELTGSNTLLIDYGPEIAKRYEKSFYASEKIFTGGADPFLTIVESHIGKYKLR